MRHRTVSGTVFDVFNTLLMLMICVVMIYPFLYIINFSLSDPTVVRKAGLLLWPRGFNLVAYEASLKHPDIKNGFIISIARSTLGPFLMVIVTSMAAFALAREDLAGRKFFNKFFIFTMYFSGGMIPVYLVMRNLNLTGSFWVYVIPGMFGAFNFVLVRTYIENIPSSLEEAALIDGANYVTAFFRVVLPVCIPVLSAIVLFSCVGHWNAFSDTRLYNFMNRDLFTMQYVLYNYLASTQTFSIEQALALGDTTQLSPESIRMAITIITIVPVMCVYPALQKHFASGLLIGSVKG